MANCKICNKKTLQPYFLYCLDCWIKFSREEKQKIREERKRNKEKIKLQKRIEIESKKEEEKNILLSKQICLNCNKTPLKRRLGIKFCDTKCAKEYYIKIGKQKEWQNNWYNAGGKERKKEYLKTFGKEKFKIWQKEYFKLHPERKLKNKGVSKEAFEKIKVAYEYKCAMCGKQEPFLDQYWPYLTQDHIFPRSKGGKKEVEKIFNPFVGIAIPKLKETRFIHNKSLIL